jgi:tetratricopeptide (TPR) repeat protein
LLHESLTIAEQAGDDRVQAQAIYGLGAVARAEDQLHEARALFNQALELFKRSGDRGGSLLAHYVLANLTLQIEGPQKALPLLEDMLLQYRQRSDLNKVGKVLLDLGDALRLLEDYDKALACYEESGRIATDLADQFGVALSLINQGQIAVDNEDWGGGITRYQEGLALLDQLNQTTYVLLAKLHLADAYRQLGDVAAAEGLYIESLQIAEKNDNPAEYSHALFGIGQIEASRNLARAAELHQQSARRYHQLKADPQLAHTLVGWLVVLARQGWRGESGTELIAWGQLMVQELGNRLDPIDRRTWQQLLRLLPETPALKREEINTDELIAKIIPQ